MKQLLQLLKYAPDIWKYLPIIMDVFEAAGKLVNAIQKKIEKEKAGEADTINENRSIFENLNEIRSVLYKMLPANIRLTATDEETKDFQECLVTLTLDIQKTITAFKKLTV